MNKQRRDRLNAAYKDVVRVREELESIRDEEEEVYDNLPESLQDAEKGSEMAYAIDCIDEAVDALYDAEGSLEEVVDAK